LARDGKRAGVEAVLEKLRLKSDALLPAFVIALTPMQIPVE
jgi:hypothetical protein